MNVLLAALLKVLLNLCLLPIKMMEQLVLNLTTDLSNVLVLVGHAEVRYHWVQAVGQLVQIQLITKLLQQIYRVDHIFAIIILQLRVVDGQNELD